jgi:hypothetical protein
VREHPIFIPELPASVLFSGSSQSDRERIRLTGIVIPSAATLKEVKA